MNTVQSMTHDQFTHETPLKCVRQYHAMRKAMKAARISAATLDLDLLIILYYAAASLTFHGMYCVNNRPDASASKYTYYAALDRLHIKQYITVEYNKKGWRLWAITPAGRAQVAQLDAAAQKYLSH